LAIPLLTPRGGVGAGAAEHHEAGPPEGLQGEVVLVPGGGKTNGVMGTLPSGGLRIQMGFGVSTSLLRGWRIGAVSTLV